MKNLANHMAQFLSQHHTSFTMMSSFKPNIFSHILKGKLEASSSNFDLLYEKDIRVVNL